SCPSLLILVPRLWVTAIGASIGTRRCRIVIASLVQRSRWIRPAPSLWAARLPGSHKKKGGWHGKNRSGFTEHRRTRRIARQRDRQTGGKGRGTAGRARGRAGKAVAVRQTGETPAGLTSGRKDKKERREEERRGEGADRKGGVTRAPDAGVFRRPRGIEDAIRSAVL